MKNVAPGMCTVCGKNEAENGRKLCRACADKKNEKQRERNNRRKASGMCYRCGKEQPKEGRGICETCSSYLTERRSKRIRAGLCEDCGKPTYSGTRCLACQDKRNAIKRAAKAATSQDEAPMFNPCLMGRQLPRDVLLKKLNTAMDFLKNTGTAGRTYGTTQAMLHVLRGLTSKSLGKLTGEEMELQSWLSEQVRGGVGVLSADARTMRMMEMCIREMEKEMAKA